MAGKNNSSLITQRRQVELQVTDFVVDREARQACCKCPHFGHNFACSPHDLDFNTYLADYRSARVIALQANLPDAEPGQRATDPQRIFGQLRAALTVELLNHRVEGHAVLGSGPCFACDPCARLLGEEACRYPDQRVYSLSSFGVNVVRLMREHLGVELEWSDSESRAATVWSVGAVFLR